MHQYLTFLLLSIVLVISPGVDTALTTKMTLASGRRAGSFLVVGLITGVLVHTLAATVGISAILMKSAIAFSIVKYVGALYLLYLGFHAIWSTRRKKQQGDVQLEAAAGAESDEEVREETNAARPVTTGLSTYRQGLLSNVLNPKIAVFFLTFLPQFVVPEANTARQLFLLGVSYAALSIVWYLAYVYFINYLRKWLQSKKTQMWMERVTGTVLIGFGIKLALEKR